MKEKVIDFLKTVQSPGKTRGLYRIQSLMKRLGNPQEQLKIIHVAGTNGKGSVSAMLTSILMESGYKVGLFTSPHLIEYNERIQIQRIPISDSDFAKTGLQVQKACNEIEKDNEDTPRFFECITAMALLHFANKNVDIVILETGIGGRLDATNIIKNPLVSVITSIGKDHMEFLGDTIEEISREKGGIIKESCPTVLYQSDKSVYNIIKEICKNKHSKLYSCKESNITQEIYTMKTTTFTVENPKFTYENIEMNLIGKYQVSNAITALMCIEALRALAYEIPKEAVYQGLKKVTWPGRMEVIQKSPTIIIDGAHNEESAKAFITSLKSIITSQKASGKIYMLIGILKGKDAQSILEILAPHAHTIIVTQSSNERAVPVSELYGQISKIKTHQTLMLENNLIDAYKTGESLLQPNDLLCCLGSLYLVGELKEFLKNRR